MLRGMGTKRGTRDVPPEWLDSVARHIEAWIVATGQQRKTGRQLAPLLGISQPTLTQLLNRKGALGIHVLMSLRNALHKSLDELLGLTPIATSVTPPSALPPKDEFRAILRAELAAMGLETAQPRPAKKTSR